jgi:predicted dehydrogenase
VPETRKLRMGMIGGGRGAFIGSVHRMAAALDGRIELAAGAFSSDPERSRLSGADLLLPEDRVYGSYAEMIARESARRSGERIDFVAIVTPNREHVPAARAALLAGFPVMCDKPLALNLGEALELRALVRKTGLLFGLTHNYSGYPMVKEARHRVGAGELGKIRRVVAEYPQGWLSSLLEATGQKQAAWRTDPARAGASCCVGDIGTHAAHLTEYVTGLPIVELASELTTFVAGRELDDDASVLLRLGGGARGVLWASQVAIDEENGLNLRVYGEKGSLEWRQEEPNTLLLKWPDRPREILRAGANYGRLSKEALGATRLPAGHPEGYLEAFANLYKAFASALLEGGTPDVPTIDDGVRGMALIEACVESSRASGRWTRLQGVEGVES